MQNKEKEGNKEKREKTIVKSGGKRTEITEEKWALSLVVHEKSQHAFLILEGLKNSQRILRVVELGYKPLNIYDSNPDEFDKSKAWIYDRSFASSKNLQTAFKAKNLKGTKSITRHITLDRVKVFKAGVEGYKDKAKAGKLNYLKTGKTPVLTFFHGSSKASIPKSSHEALKNLNQKSLEAPKTSNSLYVSQYQLTHASHDSIDPFLREGHNCMSFAIEIWKTLGLAYKESILGKFVIIPNVEIDKNIKVEKSQTGNTKCTIM